jgi:beta-galactosidase
MELLTPTTAKVIARYDHPAWKEYAAVTENAYGKGVATYIGFMPSDELLGKLLQDAVKKAGAWGVDQEIAFPLITKSGVNAQGKTVRYYFNYSAKPATFTYPHKGSKDLISGQRVANGAQRELGPWGVAIVVED